MPRERLVQSLKESQNAWIKQRTWDTTKEKQSQMYYVCIVKDIDFILRETANN
jgi:uncharacterized protein YecT (DUF1311 family)